VKVNDVVLKGDEKAQEIGCAFWIEDVVRFQLAMPRNIDDRTRNASAEKKTANSNEITLNAPVGRWIGTELKHFHRGIEARNRSKSRGKQSARVPTASSGKLCRPSNANTRR